MPTSEGAVRSRGAGDGGREVRIAHRPRRRGPPSLAACGVGLLLVKVGLRVLGFARTVGMARWVGRGVADDDVARREDVDAVLRAVSTAAAFYPGRALCLEQSLVLYACLRRCGVNADLRLGVQVRPFAAHAWVEWRGDVVGESWEHLRTFIPLPERGW